MIPSPPLRQTIQNHLDRRAFSRASGRRACAVLLVTVGLLAVLGLAACGTSNPHPPGTYERGLFFVDQQMYPEAVTALDDFIRQNPTDSLAAQAQFEKAMAYFRIEEYPLAAVELQILRKDYPTSPLVEEAYFREGEAYLAQVGKIERDITGAYEARRQFYNFLQEYPSSRFVPEVRDRLREISDLVVRKRLQQVQVYRQLQRYEAVALTLDDLLQDEAGSGLLDRVLAERAEVALELDDPATARRMYTRLLADFPDSPLAGRARSALEDLGEPSASAATP